MSDVQMTHSTDCWQWHHECAKRVIAELRADIQRTENVSRSVRSERDYAVQQIGDLRVENERLRAVVAALVWQADRDPFVAIGHWVEHGPAAAIIRDIAHRHADAHGPDWTDRDTEYLR